MDSSQSFHWLFSFWQQLTGTNVELPEPARRRARVLAVFSFVLIVSIALLSILIVFTVPPDQLIFYALVLGCAIFLLVISFRLNRNGRYIAAARLLIASTTLANWFAVLINVHTLNRDIVPIVFLIGTIVLSSFLLSSRFTLVFGVAQIIALFSLSLVGIVTLTGSWIGLLSFFLFVTVLGTVSSFISHADTAQIDLQTRLLRELSIRDPLTGLYNRRYLEESLTRELARAEREQSSLGIIMVDVDYFKGYNDAHGHAAGDALLRQVSNLLVNHIRGSDIACRYGGDELTIIMPNSSREGTSHRAEELRHDVKELLLECQEHILNPITISLGVATFPHDGESGDELLKAADDALYLAKQLGRDRVVVAN